MQNPHWSALLESLLTLPEGEGGGRLEGLKVLNRLVLGRLDWDLLMGAYMVCVEDMEGIEMGLELVMGREKWRAGMIMSWLGLRKDLGGM